MFLPPVAIEIGDRLMLVVCNGPVPFVSTLVVICLRRDVGFEKTVGLSNVCPARRQPRSDQIVVADVV